MASSHIKNVAIVGASGRVGRYFAEALLATGKHNITALTRSDSTTGAADFPPGLTKVVAIDYNDESTIISALKNQDFLIITLSVRAAQDTHSKLSTAAAKAGVRYVMPNTYGFDIFNENLRRDNPPSAARGIAYCEEIEQLKVSSWVAMCCGFWYEWSLALGESWFGISIKERKVTFFDDGKTKVSISTWQQCGRAIAAFLSLPEEGESPCVVEWKNKPLYISSFLLSQRDMLDSLNRILGTRDEDWEIRYEATQKRVVDGNAAFQQGDVLGFAKAMYSRVFFPTGDGDFESSQGLANAVLGLPKEDLDEATRRAVELVESGWNPLAH